MNAHEAKQQFQKAGQLFRAGKTADALAVLDALGAAFPNHAEIVHARALALARLGRLTEASGLCDTLTVLGDSRGEALKRKLAVQPTAPGKPQSAGRYRGTGRIKLAAAAVIALLIAVGALYYVVPRESRPLPSPSRGPIPAAAPTHAPEPSPAPPPPEQSPGTGQAPGEYVLQFPADHAIGYVYLSDKNGVQRLAAQGSLSVPPDANVRLSITAALDGIDWTKLKRIAHLEFSQSKGVKADTVKWAELDSLKKLDLSDSRFQPATLGQLASLPKLEELLIGGRGLIDDACLAEIGKLTQLKRLELGYIWERSPKITASGIAHLANLKNLEWLSLVGFDLTGNRAEPLGALPALKSLLIHCSFADDTTFKHFATMKSVEELGMQGIQVTAGMLDQIAAMTSLRSLKLGGAYGEDFPLDEGAKAALIRLRKALPRCVIPGEK